ncbi:MAG: PTS N-acetylmuramic acid transporter subunit IIBC [Enterobacteriaceae bacterium]
MADKVSSLLEQILPAIGGMDNISQCGNCMTRLRLSLHQPEQVDAEQLRRITGVLGVIANDKQLQIVLGPGKAHNAAQQLNRRRDSASHAAPATQETDLNTLAATHKQQIKTRQNRSVQQFLSRFTSIFTPLISGFIAAGLLLGIATLLEQQLIGAGQSANAFLLSLTGYMKVFGKGLFAFLSILIGYNAQKAFGGTGVNGAIIAALFILSYDPNSTAGIYAGIDSFFGVAIDPRGNIIGVLIAAMLGAWIEVRIRRFIPDNLDMVLTSTLTLLIMGAVTFTLIMPLAGVLFKGMSWLFVHLNGNPFGSATLAGLFLLAVMFGIHQGFVPVYFALMDAQGFNSLFPILSMAGAGQVGAALALFVKARAGGILRNQIKGALIPGILGIGEPLIYGVTLPRIKPFVTACLGGAAGGFFLGLIAWLGLPVGLNTVFGPSGIIAIPLMTSAQGVFVAMSVYIGGLAVAYLAGFIITWLFGCKGVDLE